MEWTKGFILFTVAILGVDCQDEGPCMYTGWNTERIPCPNGTIEMYREVDQTQEVRFCCNPDHEDFKTFKNAANTCRTTSCQPSTTTDICSTLDPRFINNGDNKLEYEEILQESCALKNGQGLLAVCCVKNSSESLLATTLGAEPNEFPHQAKLRLPGHCGGTIYNSRFIITAAHCVVGQESKEVKSPVGMEVILGSNIGDIEVQEYIYKVKKIIAHSNYSRLNGSSELEENPESPRIFNDIALMELDREIKFGPKVKALEIAPKEFMPLQYADKTVIVGWGTTDTLDLSVHLQKSNFLIRSDQSCFQNENGPHSEMNGMENQLLCVGGIFEDKWSPTAGGGDSGGPAVCRSPNGRIVLCGVTSYGGSDEDCARDQEESTCIPSVYAEVSYFHDWIKENAGEQDPGTFYQPFLYGEQLELNQHIHQVYISSSEGKACGGTLVAPDVVITAAQCVARGDGSAQPLKDVLITAGMNDLNDWGKSYPMANLKVLPGFKMDGDPVDPAKQGNRVMIADNFYKNDLAVVKLEKLTQITQFPQLPKEDEKAESGMEMAFLRNTTYTSKMMQREFRFLNKADCQARMNRMSRVGMSITVDENLLCGVEKYSGGSLCDRELGGGVICKGENGQDVLCGVQVFRLCELSIPNGFIDISLYSNWIKEKMAEL